VFVKPIERVEAQRLRREEGMSVKVIARRLGVSVSSVSRWTRQIELTAAQVEALRHSHARYAGQLRGAQERRRSARAARLAAQEHGRVLARRSDMLHLQGCMLYWAEGSKLRNVAALTNSDADMLARFLRFLRECYRVEDERIALSVNCHLGNGLSLETIERWWRDRLGLPASCARAPVVNRPSSASRWRRNVLPYGTARISVCSTFVVQSIYGGIQEYAEIERPEWLD
jgi:transcriptional regulator with XRE-family HTH domain